MDMLGGVRDQSQMSGPLNSDGHGSLVLGTSAAFATRINSASLRDILAQFAGIFIIHYIDFVAAEGANLPLGDIFRSFPLSLWF